MSYENRVMAVVMIIVLAFVTGFWTGLLAHWMYDHAPAAIEAVPHQCPSPRIIILPDTNTQSQSIGIPATYESMRVGGKPL